MSAARKRWAVVGAGSVGPSHAYCLTTSPHAELVAVVDPDAERREETASRHGARPVASLAELLATDPPDAVSLALPTSLHEAAARQALDAGVAVLCEKPLAPDSGSCRRMIAAAEASGTPLGALLNYRGYRQLRAVKQAIGEGRLHPIAAGVDAALHLGPERSATPLDRGIVLAVGVHFLDLLRWWLGEPVAVAAVASGEPPAEDCAAALVGFPGGVHACLGFTRTPAPHEPARLRLECVEGRVLLLGSVASFVAAPEATADFELPPPEDTPSRLIYGAGHVRALHEAAQALTEGRAFPVAAEEGARAVELCETCYEAARRGAWVDGAPSGQASDAATVARR